MTRSSAFVDLVTPAGLILCLIGAKPVHAEVTEIEPVGGPVVQSLGLVGVSAQATPTVAQGQSKGTHVVIGRNQDIVGIPVDIRHPRRAGSVQAGPALLPTRLPLKASALTGRFGLRQHPIYGNLRIHSGIDLAAPLGTPVYATASGTVSVSGWTGGYGIMVAIEHSGGMETRFGHLSRAAVSGGQSVRAGELIGYVGSTGDSTGPHLHYEIRINGQPINPLAR